MMYNIPADLSNVEDKARWIFSVFKKELWLELDLDVNIDPSEIKKITPYYVKHRGSEEHTGWSSCCLHGISVNQTEDRENYPKTSNNYSWTEIATVTPTITNFWKNVFPAESYNRIRFMKLDPGGVVNLHRDADPNKIKDHDILDNGVAVNFAITHPEECVMRVKNKIVPWKPMKLIMLNVSQLHSVENLSSSPRVHMIAHCNIGNKKQEFCELIVRSFLKQYGCT